MHLAIVGYDDEEQRRLVKAAALFASLLFEPKLRKEIWIQVQHDPYLDKVGECWPEDEEYLKFVISIRAHYDDFARGYEDDPVSTLAHEMTHCRQWATGDLRAPAKVYKDPLTGEDRILIDYEWKGNPWIKGSREVEAWDSPWEIEAYGRERTLYCRWEMIDRGRITLK